MKKQESSEIPDQSFMDTVLEFRQMMVKLWTAEEFRCHRCGVDLSKGFHADFCMYSDHDSAVAASSSDYIHSVGLFSTLKTRYPLW